VAPRTAGRRRGRRAGTPALLVLALAVAPWTGGCRGDAHPASPGTPRNLLWIVVDTLRADRLSCYGGAVATPAVDGLAATGVRFEHATSHIPITGPSHATMFTGKLPLHHGVQENTDVLRAEQTTIAEMFQRHGFRTAAVISLGVLAPRFGFAQGFDHVDARFSTQWFRPGDEITDAAIATAPAVDRGRFFLFVHYSDPHEPYAPPTDTYTPVRVMLNGADLGVVQANGHGYQLSVTLKPGANRFELTKVSDQGRWRLLFHHLKVVGPQGELEMRAGAGWTTPPQGKRGRTVISRLPATLEVVNPDPQPVPATLGFYVKEQVPLAEKRRRYDREVAYVDRQIGRLLDALRARGDLEDTLVVFTSDHGEGMGDHGLVGHIHQLYDSLLRVPLILSGPGVGDPRVERERVGLVDLVPTLLDVFGLPSPPDLSGRSLVGRPQDRPTPLLAMTFAPESRQNLLAVMAGRYKLILDTDSRERELYDLVDDPGELNDLHSLRPDLEPSLVQVLRTALKERRSRSRPGRLSSDETRHLEALGYVR